MKVAQVLFIEHIIMKMNPKEEYVFSKENGKKMKIMDPDQCWLLDTVEICFPVYELKFITTNTNNE